MFFLLTALSQLIPILKIGNFILTNNLGFLITYLGPLIFVLIITMLKEAFDDLKRFQRDK